MNIITLDFETYFDDEYSLSKGYTTESYIRDKKFEAHGCAIKFPSFDRAEWWDGNELKQVFADIDWSTTACLAHHAQFDGLILSHHYGVKPAFWLDTLSMARLLLGNHLSVGLESLAKHFQLSAKNVPYNLFKGKHWNEIAKWDVGLQVANGACHDVDLTWQLFNILGRDMPREEYQTISTTVKMFTEPCLVGDVDLLGKVWVDEATKKDARMAALNVSSAELQSADKFAALLRAEGVEPETKEGKNKPIYCFAKTDEFMRGLQEHDNERIRTLCEARLGAKSTLTQTRAETLGWMASRGNMPVYLRYCGAHTTRWSGGDGANWQNFKRGSDIRRAIMAPPGFLLAPIDLSQIECRIVNHLAGQQDIIQAFREGRDLYSEGASRFYGRTITKADKQERHLGKTLELGCGYQMGWLKFQLTCKAGALGGPRILLTDTEAKTAVDSYRNSHPAVVEYWKTAGRMISRLAGGDPLEWGPMLIKDHKIFGPGGTMLHYETLQHHVPAPDEEYKEFEREGYWRYRTRHGWTKLYSGKLVENVVQWLARIVMSQTMNRLVALDFRIVNCTHDEVLLLLPKDGTEQQRFAVALAEMKRSPEWLPGIPLDAEGAMGERYAK